MNSSLRAASFPLTAWPVVALVVACGAGKPQQPDLQAQADRWVSTVVLDAESVAKYVGKTKDHVVTSSSEVRTVDGLKTISVGDEICLYEPSSAAVRRVRIGPCAATT